MWATAKQRHVPAELLGRVSSLDWLVSTGLMPLSFAFIGAVSSAIGAKTTLIAAGAIGGLVSLGALRLPGVRALEDRTRQASRSPPPPRRTGTHRLLAARCARRLASAGWTFPGYSPFAGHW